MAKKKRPPRFVNLTARTVMVFDEDKRTLRVAPWTLHDDRRDAIFVVEGDHYSQFVSGQGPLAPFPDGAPLPDHGVVGAHASRDAIEKAVDAPAPAARLVPPPAAPTPAPPASGGQAGEGDQGTSSKEDQSGADEEVGAGTEESAGDGAGDESTDDLEGAAEEADKDVTGTVEVDVDDDELEEDAPSSKRTLTDRVLGRRKPAKKKKRG